MLGGRRWFPIGIGTRVFRKIRRGHAGPAPVVFGRVGTRLAARSMHVAELITLVNDRLAPRLSLRYLAHGPLAGSAIANIVVGSQILPIAAQVALAAITEVAAQVLPVGTQIGLVSRQVPPISLNVGSVAGDVALIIHAVTLAGPTVGVVRRLLARGVASRRGGSRDAIVVVAAQVLSVRAQIRPVAH